MSEPVNHRLREWVYHDESPIHGKGVFARREIAPGEYIGSYQGPIAKRNGTYVLWVQEEHGGDWYGISGRNTLRYLNHSRDPSAAFDGPRLYALKPITAGQEITFDYGDECGLD